MSYTLTTVSKKPAGSQWFKTADSANVAIELEFIKASTGFVDFIQTFPDADTVETSFVFDTKDNFKKMNDVRKTLPAYIAKMTYRESVGIVTESKSVS